MSGGIWFYELCLTIQQKQVNSLQIFWLIGVRGGFRAQFDAMGALAVGNFVVKFP
jgi:hypothetical protein